MYIYIYICIFRCTPDHGPIAADSFYCRNQKSFSACFPPPSLCPSLPSLLVVSMERIASQFVKTPSSSDPSQLHFYHAGKQEDACGSELRAMTHKGARNYQHKAY